jgi:nicotinamide riboside kinase
MSIPWLELPVPDFPAQRVALYGPMCSGKTYLANKMKEREYIKLSFATKLKDVAEDLFYINTKDKNNYNRKLLQEFSDDVKKWDSDIWTKYLINSAEWYARSNAKIVIDDLRFVREAEKLKENDFLLIKVECDDYLRAKRVLDLYPDTKP